MNLKHLLIVVAITFTAFAQGSRITRQADNDPPTHWCRLDGTDCIFSGVELTKEQPRFKPAAENVLKIRKVIFQASIIPYFTDDICNAFPEIEALDVMNAKVEEISEDAFNSCKNIKTIRFQHNQIRKLGENIFRHNEKLEELRFGHNEIQELPLMIFSGLPNLNLLWMENNQLIEFPVDLVQYNSNLKHLAISSNHLSNVDFMKILEYLPNLQRVWYNNNEFSCNQVRKMNAEFTSKNVEIIVGAYGKERFYPIQTIDEIECAPDISWSAAFYRKLMNPPVSTPVAEMCFMKNSENIEKLVTTALAREIKELKKENREIKIMIQELVTLFSKNQ